MFRANARGDQVYQAISATAAIWPQRFRQFLRRVHSLLLSQLLGPLDPKGGQVRSPEVRSPGLEGTGLLVPFRRA